MLANIFVNELNIKQENLWYVITKGNGVPVYATDRNTLTSSIKEQEIIAFIMSKNERRINKIRGDVMKQLCFFDEMLIDNFAGGGGTSTGIELATGRPVDAAINHDPDAMLTPRELYNANGFPPDYIIDHDYTGKSYGKTKQVARCGNAVPPPFAEALVRANLSELCGRKLETMENLKETMIS